MPRRRRSPWLRWPTTCVGASRPDRRPVAAIVLAIATLACAPAALAGAQKQEPLSAAIRSTLAKSVTDRDLARGDDADTRAWVNAMHGRVHQRVRDDRVTRDLLVMVRYEALRAGLDPRLVLAVIDVESGFRKYAVSSAGARGYMQVMPFWVREIGMPGQNLFQMRTNLRYGCVILRHYLRMEDGNLHNALGRYNGSLGRPEYPERVLRALSERWSTGA
ncbi:MAG: transglycosylase SLT domain-containing protein [Betaproteobacteria bacterium]|nr:transglycosylase SLT domain-containing protein [Betaproteobacteria bacterium]